MSLGPPPALPGTPPDERPPVTAGPPAADDASPPDADPAAPPELALQDRLPEWFRTTKAAPLFAFALGLAFFLFASLPLWHTDLWGHLAYGRVIWFRGGLPATEPLMPLARGVEFVDTAWLSQLVGYLTATRFGVAGLQFLAGLCVTAAAGLVARTAYRKTGSVGWTMLGLAAFFWMSWKQFFGAGVAVLIRPQMAGLVLFAATLAIVTSRPRRWHWVAVPLLFAAWANLHGSFPVGLALLASYAVGRAGDVLRRTDRFAAIVRDRPFWRLVMLTELAAAAVLLNPYGLRIYADVLLFSRNPNLAGLVEWQPLTLRMSQGQAVAAVAFALLFLYRMTPRRITTGEAIALLGFGGATLWTSRMIVWWAPLAAYCLAVHAAAVWDAHRAKAAKRRDVEPAAEAVAEPPLMPARRSIWTVTAIGIVWIAFALTPFAQQLLHGQARPFEQSVSRQTPLGAAKHLGENPPAGQVFNAYEYGDYLLWATPRVPVFVAGHAHLVPTEVWNAYTDAIGGKTGWEAVLDRYGVNAIVLDRPGRQSFIDRLAEEPAWEETYRDHNSAVFRRREPIR